ncbi:hypothetical protein SNE35_22330 [Paucibacter sp. R3-3]|uniref:Uncharacterized protein n=1 Tax=Roseateles agri TaxID=3098619 RepID=A0ABU5DLT0_9BURK|nr:hypothetical protein [Paucibacter sp. R3-3]MDY0747260.1 hypothetical protein [Paucibacter sp. R3-3]
MSERPNTDAQSVPATPASARRRRFIKGGAGLIPVALTLNSRPVLATTTTTANGQCFSASAWGSMQALATNASQYTRLVNSGRVTTVACYDRATWCGKQTVNKVDYATCTGWKANRINCADLTLAKVKNYTVGQACGNSAGTAGIGGTVTCWDVVSGAAGCSQAQQAVIVAWLNCQITTTTNTETCVLDTYLKNQLTTLGNCVPNGGIGPDGKTWRAVDVLNYLQNNKIGKVS